MSTTGREGALDGGDESNGIDVACGGDLTGIVVRIRIVARVVTGVVAGVVDSFVVLSMHTIFEPSASGK